MAESSLEAPCRVRARHPRISDHKLMASDVGYVGSNVIRKAVGHRIRRHENFSSALRTALKPSNSCARSTGILQITFFARTEGVRICPSNILFSLCSLVRI